MTTNADTSSQSEGETIYYRRLAMGLSLFDLAYQVKYHQLQLKTPDAPHELLHQQTLDLIEKGCKS